MINLVQKNYETPNYAKQKASFSSAHLNGYSTKELQKAFVSDLTGIVQPSKLEDTANAHSNLIKSVLKPLIKRFRNSDSHNLTLTLAKPEGSNQHNLTAVINKEGGAKQVHIASLGKVNQLSDLLHSLRTFLPAPKN